MARSVVSPPRIIGGPLDQDWRHDTNVYDDSVVDVSCGTLPTILVGLSRPLGDSVHASYQDAALARRLGEVVPDSFEFCLLYEALCAVVTLGIDACELGDIETDAALPMPGVDIIAGYNPEAARPCRMQEKLQKMISSARFSSYLEMLSGASQHLVRWIVRCNGESGPGTGATPTHLRRAFVYGQGTSLWSTNGDDVGSILFSNESQISVFSFSSRMYTRAAE